MACKRELHICNPIKTQQTGRTGTVLLSGPSDTQLNKTFL